MKLKTQRRKIKTRRYPKQLMKGVRKIECKTTEQEVSSYLEKN